MMDAIGDYQIVRSLGRGGMAETYLAQRNMQDGFEQRVCLKRILPRFAEDRDFLKSLVEEARVCAKLRHPNIVQILDFGIEPDAFLALELIEGCDLRALLLSYHGRNESFPAGLVAFVAEQVANALRYAHEQGVVHRDISPANILVSDAGEVKLADFGIAKALDAEGHTQTGLVKGKIPYMAPEYARGEACDVKSDLFALGVTLYELATYQRPYRGKNNVEVLEAVTLGRFESLEHTDLPPELCALIEACIAPKRTDRPADMAHFLELLSKVPPPPTARRLLARAVRAHRERPSVSANAEQKRPLTPAEAAPTAVAGVMDATSVEATIALQAGARPPAEEVRLATPDAETQTRLPVAQEETVEHDNEAAPAQISDAGISPKTAAIVAAAVAAALVLWWLIH